MKIIFIVIVAALILLGANTLRAGETITFSVSPERNTSELAKLWIPVLNELSDQSGLKFSFTTAPNAKQFNKRLKQGEIDIAFVDPYAFSSFHLTDYQALAKPQSLQEEAAPMGVIVVHRHSAYYRLEDLEGKTFAFSDRESFSASVLPRFHMQASGMPYKASFSRSSMSSALAVSRGLFDAAGLEVRFFNSLPKSLQENLRVVWTSTPSDLCQGMQNHPFVFAVNKKLAPTAVSKLKKGLLAMNETVRGQNLLKTLGIQAIQPADNSEWSGMQQLAQRIFQE